MSYRRRVLRMDFLIGRRVLVWSILLVEVVGFYFWEFMNRRGDYFIWVGFIMKRVITVGIC